MTNKLCTTQNKDDVSIKPFTFFFWNPDKLHLLRRALVLFYSLRECFQFGFHDPEQIRVKVWDSYWCVWNTSKAHRKQDNSTPSKSRPTALKTTGLTRGSHVNWPVTCHGTGSLHKHNYSSHKTQGKNTRQQKQHMVTQHRAYHSSSAKLPSSISDLCLLSEVENS